MRKNLATGMVAALMIGLFLANVANAQLVRKKHPVLVIPGETQIVEVIKEGLKTEMPTEVVWRPMCGCADGILEEKSLAEMAVNHAIDVAAGQKIVDNTVAEAGLNVVFVLGASVPAAAVPSFATAESYLEAEFPNDTMTITIDVSFASLSPGVIGGTSSSYGYVDYTTARSVLVSGMDGNDVIQSYLPSGSSAPVRYSAKRTTNENRVFFTFANWKATGGTVSGNDASMQFSTNFPFDYDPSDGVNPNTISLIDVIIHETGHAMGFTSGVDFRFNDIETLDLFRFRNTDGGSADFNPDTYAEFTVRPRWAVFNSPNDDANFDLIVAEYYASDGSPYQASHFREQTPSIGIMDPAFSYGQTFYPFYLMNSDISMFDAMGYDR